MSRRTVGSARGSVYEELPERSGGSLPRGHGRIGIDETGHERGHRYTAVVVDHGRGRAVWAREGHGKEVLALFLDEPDGADGGEARALPDRWPSRALR